MHHIEWKQKAIKQLKQIDKTQQKKIVIASKNLTNLPDCQGVKALENHKYQYRLRVGRYRVLFDVESEIKIINIEEVKKRDGRTY